MPRNFDGPVPGFAYLSELETAPLDLSGWNEPAKLKFADIRWAAFLDGAGIHPAMADYCADYFESLDSALSVSALVHVVKLFYQPAAASQALPLQADLVEQLHSIRRAAARLCHLVQGGDGKGQPVEAPEWYRKDYGIDVESDGSLHPTLVRATPDIHPWIHDAIHQARVSRFPKGVPQGEAERKAWNHVGAFFSILRQGLETVDRAIEQAKAQGGKNSAQAHRPANDARKWALSRLLWVWRDMIGKPVELGMTKTRDRSELEVPDPGPCIGFVIAAMEHMTPASPNQYRVLQTELHRLKSTVPEENLVIS